jgi:voltage-gated potassium channel
LTAGGAVVIAHYEGLPLGDALYFASVTGLTIGKADIVVKSTVGKFVAILIGFMGVLFSGLIVAAALRAAGQSIKKGPQ